MRLLNICCGSGRRSHRKTQQLLWLLVFIQFLSNSNAFFFPMFSNLFSNAAFRNNQNGNSQFRGLAGIHERLQQNSNGGGGGGVSIFSPSTASSNQSTSIRVPMFERSVPALQRRVDIVTTVINPAEHLDEHQKERSSDGNSTSTNGTSTLTVNGTRGGGGGSVEVHQNVSTTFPDQTVQQTSQRFVIPTKTSVTSSISAIQNGVPVQMPGGNGGGIGLTGISRNSDLVTPLQFQPNMFGILSFVQALKNIKHNYKNQEIERKMDFHNKQNGGGDLMTRILRTLIQKVVNKHQKHTDFLKLKIAKKEAKMQSFLQLPMVAQVIAFDEARVSGGLTQPQQQVQQIAGAVTVPQAKSLQLPVQPPKQQQRQHPHHQQPHHNHQHPHHQQNSHHQNHHPNHQQHNQQNQQRQGLFGRRPGGPLRNLLNSFLI